MSVRRLFCQIVAVTGFLGIAGLVTAQAPTNDSQAAAVWPALVKEGPLAQEVVREVELKPSLTFRVPGGNDEWLENGDITIRWVATGPIRTVRLYYYGELTRLAGEERGSFSNVIADQAPNTGEYKWVVPWIDASGFLVRIAGFDDQGKMIAETERGVNFRPHEADDLSGTFIAVSKRRQRLWYYHDNQLKWISIVSTAADGYETPEMSPGSGGRRGEMGRVFYKDPDAFSHQYQVHMLWWMAITSSGSHGIHATSPNLYDNLGEPASHGCIRQTRSDAHQLYEMVSVGTRVYVR